jgi:hypothetical protein
MSLTGGPLTSTVELQTEMQKQALERRRKNGASWFYWVAGLSVINSAILMSGGGMAFMFGLGITQLVDAFAMRGSGGQPGVLPIGALAVDVLLAGAIAIVGYFAFRGHTSAYISGMVLYTLDGLVVLLAGAYLSAGFHLFVLWGMWRGLEAHRALSRLSPADQAPASLAGGAA